MIGLGGRRLLLGHSMIPTRACLRLAAFQVLAEGGGEARPSFLVDFGLAAQSVGSRKRSR